VLPPAVSARLRAHRAAPSADAAPAREAAPLIGARSAGRPRQRDVLLRDAGQPHRWWLRVDTGHPVLFDHPVDHVPGMLLLDAARQAAHAELGAGAVPPLALDADFGRFVELGAPCRVEVTARPPLPGDPPGGHRTRVLFRHPGDAAPRCTADLALDAPAPAPAALPGQRARGARAAAPRG
jgi:hypothetical protein